VSGREAEKIARRVAGSWVVMCRAGGGNGDFSEVGSGEEPEGDAIFYLFISSVDLSNFFDDRRLYCKDSAI